MEKELNRKDVREMRVTRIKQILCDDDSKPSDYYYGILLGLTEIIESLPIEMHSKKR